MRGLWPEGDEVPEHVRVLEVRLGVPLLCVDETVTSQTQQKKDRPQIETRAQAGVNQQSSDELLHSASPSTSNTPHHRPIWCACERGKIAYRTKQEIEAAENRDTISDEAVHRGVPQHLQHYLIPPANRGCLGIASRHQALPINDASSGTTIVSVHPMAYYIASVERVLVIQSNTAKRLLPAP